MQLKTKRDRSKATAAVSAAIRELRNLDRLPAEFLESMGVKGICGDPWACVLAAYFNKVLLSCECGGVDGFVAYVADDRVLLIEGDRPHDITSLSVGSIDPGLNLPIPYCELIEEFDLGRLPQLVLQGAA